MTAWIVAAPRQVAGHPTCTRPAITPTAAPPTNLSLQVLAELGHEGEEDGAAEAQRGGHRRLAVLQQAEAQVLLDGANKALGGAELRPAVLQQDLQQLQGQHLW